MNVEDIQYIAIHCSATKGSMDVTANDVDRWHRQKLYKKIGYHFFIRRNGMLEKGRELYEVGAHVQNYNSCSIGICLAGGLDEKGKAQNNFTNEQWNTLKELLLNLRKTYPKAIIQGHRDFPKVNKDCPCFDVKQWCITNNIN